MKLQCQCLKSYAISHHIYIYIYQFKYVYIYIYICVWQCDVYSIPWISCHVKKHTHINPKKLRLNQIATLWKTKSIPHLHFVVLFWFFCGFEVQPWVNVDVYLGPRRWLFCSCKWLIKSDDGFQKLASRHLTTKATEKGTCFPTSGK